MPDSEAHKENTRSFVGMAVGGVLFAFLVVGWVILRLVRGFNPPDFEHAPNLALHFLSLCFGIAGLTTTCVQMVRILFPLRGAFQRKRLEERWQNTFDRWRHLETAPTDKLESAVAVLGLLVPGNQNLADGGAVAALIEFESRGGRGISMGSPIWLYDLPIEQLTGQLALTLDAALDDHAIYPFLLLCTFGPSASPYLRDALQDVRERQSGVTDPKDERPKPDPKVIAKGEARATLMRLAQFEVDAIQITIGSLWRRKLRINVVAMSTIISFSFIGSSLWKSAVNDPLAVALYSLVGGLVSGYMAMILRDIFAVIEGRRRGA